MLQERLALELLKLPGALELEVMNLQVLVAQRQQALKMLHGLKMLQPWKLQVLQQVTLELQTQQSQGECTQEMQDSWEQIPQNQETRGTECSGNSGTTGTSGTVATAAGGSRTAGTACSGDRGTKRLRAQEQKTGDRRVSCYLSIFNITFSKDLLFF